MSMSVAEKPVTETAPANPHVQLALRSLAAAAVLLAALWFLFAGLPLLWEWLGVQRTPGPPPRGLFNPFLSDSLLLIVTALLGVGLGYLALRYEQAHPLKGRRAGAIVGAIFLFFAARLTIAFGSYLAGGEMTPVAGTVVTLGIGAVLLWLVFWLFKKPGFGARLQRMEDNGWFNFQAYKGSQGVRVRRCTVIGLLVVGFAGILTLITQRKLEEGPWAWRIPFLSLTHKEVEDKRGELTKLNDKLSRQDLPAQEREKHRQEAAQIRTDLQAGQLPLMFRVNWVLPVVLSAILVWWVWRLVNQPTFADFLIATEAEMNKVSWTTRKRLVQDTIVVLVTVFLMTVFLLIIDLIWIQVLKHPWIYVLRVNPSEELAKQREKTQW
jgi:preprotein translocase SecE subunit